MYTCSMHYFFFLSQEFSLDPVIPIYSAKPDLVKKALKYVHSAALDKLGGKELELLIAILPDNNGSLYGMILSHSNIILRDSSASLIHFQLYLFHYIGKWECFFLHIFSCFFFSFSPDKSASPHVYKKIYHQKNVYKKICAEHSLVNISSHVFCGGLLHISCLH